MTAFRASFWVLAAAAIVLPPPANAEPAATPRLLAQAAPPVTLAPRRPVEVAPPAEPAPQPATPTGPQRKVPVEIRTLSEVDPDSIGVIDSSQGGFGVNMWEGTDRRLVAKLLPLLPAQVRSPAMRDLMRRLLLTRATVPAGKPASPSLLTLRVERLFAMGDLSGARQLLDSAPAQAIGEGLTRIRVESLFFGNDNSGACKEVRSNVQQYQGSYWQQATAFCLALSGEHAKAAMVADILAEREGAADPAFFTVMEALSGVRNTVIDGLDKPRALHISMMRAANLRLPANIAASNKPAILRAVALSPNADLSVRLVAAESAHTLGALAVAELGELYAGIRFERNELENPLTTADAKWGPRGRALLLRATAGQNVPTARAEVLKRAWLLAKEKGGYRLMLSSSLPALLTIEPAGELAWFALDAGRALYSAGRRAEAMGWLALARQEAGANGEAAAAAAALWPLAVLSDVEESIPVEAAEMEKWWQAQKAGNGDAAIARGRLLFGLLSALNQPVGTALWTEVIGEGRPETALVPNPALRHALGIAAANLRVGETVMLALTVLGEPGTAGAGAQAVETAVAALGAVGLRKEARALALEAAIAAGI